MLHREVFAGSLKTAFHSNFLLLIQAQTKEGAGVLLAFGTENAQFGPGCQEPMRLSFILPSWILDLTLKVNWFHMAGQILESICVASLISSCPLLV